MGRESLTEVDLLLLWTVHIDVRLLVESTALYEVSGYWIPHQSLPIVKGYEQRLREARAVVIVDGFDDISVPLGSFGVNGVELLLLGRASLARFHTKGFRRRCHFHLPFLHIGRNHNSKQKKEDELDNRSGHGREQTGVLQFCTINDRFTILVWIGVDGLLLFLFWVVIRGEGSIT